MVNYAVIHVISSLATLIVAYETLKSKYVLYADDFIVSVLGPHSFAKLIKSEIEGFSP